MPENTKLGMIVFVASEATFFIFLILAFVFLGSGRGSGPSASSSLHPATTGFYTVLLVASSLTAAMAGRNIKRGRGKAMRLWLALTIVLGAAFLSGQVREYLHLFADNVTASSNVFATSFFTLTGLHGLHVLVGLLLLSTVAIFFRAHDVRTQAPAFDAISLYWHFVDVVWLVIFSIVYLGAAR